MKHLASLLLILSLLLSVSAAAIAETSPEPVETALAETEAPTEPAAPAAPATPDEPVPDAVHAPYIGGMPDGGFYPNAEISRAELAVILYSLGDYAPGPERFFDVRAKAWYAEAVNALAAAGVLGGMPDGSFQPNAKASRAELVTILAAVSGETSTDPCDFSDVSSRHWAADAIALAQEKGWVVGFADGSFRPGKKITRAETVVILNQFLGRVPDADAIAAGEGLRFFPDVRKGRWYYEAVMEAATAHVAHYDAADAPEHWQNPTPGEPAPIPDGFYCFDGRLFAVEDGAYVRAPETRTLNGILYTCAGSSGVCAAETEVLTLANGELLLLTGGKPDAAPGSYRDGLYLKAGHLYVAQGGYLLRSECSGSCNGVSYVCTGPSGRCTVEDWTALTLNGVDLSVFAEALTPEATAAGPEAVTIAELLRAAVRVYEAYFRVEYPLCSDEDRDYLDKALEYGILDQLPDDCDLPVKRGEAVYFLWQAVRGRELAPTNRVTGIRDVAEDAPCYSCLLDFYRAGVMEGFGAEHAARINEPVTATELAELLARLEQPARRVAFTCVYPYVRSFEYGVSGSGQYPLTGVQLGTGKNVMVLTFAIHGWEDNWNRDGEALVYLADQTKRYLEDNYPLISDGDWTVYVLRCLNPDGLYLGTSCNGPGRCTTTSYDAAGALVNRGIDMNRCFPYHFRCYTEARNYNGSAPLACKEARAIADFVTQAKGSGFNLLIDTHGWYGQIITSNGTGTLYNAFHDRFPASSYTSLDAASGFLSGWAGHVMGYDSCLFELPRGIYSLDAFRATDCVARFEASIRELLLHYNGPNATRSAAAQVESAQDGN